MTFGGVPLWAILPWLFVFGACVGSFLNVCIHRIPMHERLWDQLRGLTHPPSRCPFCMNRILAIDNIPIFGWLFLRGRCRFCRHWIPPRYALIEFFNGALWVILYVMIVPAGFRATAQQSCLWSPLSPLAQPGMTFTDQVFWLHAQYFYYLVLVESLVVVTFIDFDLFIIPDGSTIPAMIVGVLAAFSLGHLQLWPVWFQCWDATESGTILLPGMPHFHQPSTTDWFKTHTHLQSLLTSIAGFVIGGGLVWLVRILGAKAFKQEAMGFGDVILMAMIGTFIGWQATIIVFFLAPMCALISVAMTYFFRRESEIPYGPYLSIATLLTILFWRPYFSKLDEWFCIGPVLLGVAVAMLLMLAFSLLIVQFLKRALGFAEPAGSDWVWTSADQLAFYANKDTSTVPTSMQSPNPPHATAGQGRQFVDRWRSGVR